MVLDAIRDARLAWPHAAIDLAVGEWNAPLAALIPGLRHVHVASVPWLARGEAADTWHGLVSKARTWRTERYDLVVNFEPDIRSNALAWLTGAPRRFGYASGGGAAFLTHAFDYQPDKHVRDNARDLVASAAAGPTPDEARSASRLEVPAHATERAREDSCGRWAAARRSSRQRRPRVEAVASEPFRRSRCGASRAHDDATIVLTGGPADRALVDEIKSALGGLPVIDVGRCARHRRPGGTSRRARRVGHRRHRSDAPCGRDEHASRGALRPVESRTLRSARVEVSNPSHRLAVQPLWTGAAASRAVPRPRPRLLARHRGRSRGRCGRGPADVTAASVTCFTKRGAGQRVALSDLLKGTGRDETRELAYRWIKSLRLVRYGTATMRERFLYRGDSLWWFTEIYLHKVRHLEDAVATVVALDRARQTFEPDRMAVDADSRAVVAAALAFGRARGLSVTATGRTLDPLAGFASYREALSARLSRFRPAKRWTAPASDVAAFVHTAFWRHSGSGGSGEESYIGPVLDRLKHAMGPAGLTLVGVGPSRNFRARRWWDPVLRSAATVPDVTPVQRFSRGKALAGSNAVWKARAELGRSLTTGDEIRSAGIVRGCDLWPVLEQELIDVALLQWPWSARVMDEAGAALDAISPKVVVTYAEAGGWGRAIVLEARRRGIPSVGLQHGFIYRHWLNYLHEPDEVVPLNGDGGFPAPDRTLLFDAHASEHLQTSGHLPAERLVVTGSARLDDLKARVEQLRARRDQLRQEFGVVGAAKLIVLAAKFSEIREELPTLFSAVGAQPGIRLIIKTHPAETSTSYETLASGIPNISIAPAEADLARLLAAADARGDDELDRGRRRARARCSCTGRGVAHEPHAVRRSRRDAGRP